MTASTSTIAPAKGGATAFAVHAAAYWFARGAYENYRDQCQAPLAKDDPLHYVYDAAYAPLVSAMTDSAINAVRCPASSLAELTEKLAIFRREDMQDHEDVKDLIAVIHADAQRIGSLEASPQATFESKLAAYRRAVEERDRYDAARRPEEMDGLNDQWREFEAAMDPLYSAVFDAGKAVLLEPAANLAALRNKRTIFDALEFWGVGDEPEVFAQLFDDAAALAGGAK